MKTTICAKELKELEACEEGYNTFYEAHKEATVKLSEALKSNGLEDLWWLLGVIEGQLSKQQMNSLHLLACNYAETFLENFEKEFPNDDRPRKAIESKRLWVAGKVGDEELKVARLEARSAAWSAESAAGSAESAAWSAAGLEQKEQLMQVLLSWEKGYE